MNSEIETCIIQSAARFACVRLAWTEERERALTEKCNNPMHMDRVIEFYGISGLKPWQIVLFK